MQDEVWTDIPNFPGYKVSTYGRILSCRKNTGGKKVGRMLLSSVWKERRPCIAGRERNPYMVLTVRSPLLQVGKVYKLKIHRLVWECFNTSIPDNMQIDHINGNTLDNRLSNLRLVNGSQNHMNQKPRDGRKFKGIEKTKDKYKANITSKGKKYYLGTYSNDIEAAKAYNTAAIMLHGEYARLNNIEESDHV